MERKSAIGFKFLLVGESEVGKSSLTQRLILGTFNERYDATNGISRANKKLNCDGQDVHLQIWDTAGPDKMAELSTHYYRNCQGIMIIYDITKQESFESIQGFVREVRVYCGHDVSILLVGNKTDLESNRVVDTKTAQEKAEEEKLDFIETSASDKINIEEAFLMLVRAAVRKTTNASDSKQSETKVTKDKSKTRTCNLL